MLPKHDLCWEILVYKLLTVQFEKIHNWHLIKNLINISNNVNLIIDTYKCLFTQLLLRIFDVVRQLGPFRPYNTNHQDSVEMEKFWNLQRPKYHNGAKMIDRWNVNKLTPERNKMEVGKLWARVAQWWSRCHHQTKWARM